MPLRAGQYEVRLSRIPKYLMHGIDHLVYNLENIENRLPTSIVSFIFGFIVDDMVREREFNRRHERRFPAGSYEVLSYIK